MLLARSDLVKTAGNMFMAQNNWIWQPPMDIMDLWHKYQFEVQCKTENEHKHQHSEQSSGLTVLIKFSLSLNLPNICLEHYNSLLLREVMKKVGQCMQQVPPDGVSYLLDKDIFRCQSSAQANCNGESMERNSGSAISWGTEGSSWGTVIISWCTLLGTLWPEDGGKRLSFFITGLV